MTPWDRRPPNWIRAAQDRALARYVARVVYPYSSYYRPRLDAAGLGRRGVRSVANLARLPLVGAAEISEAPDLVLRPEEAAIRRWGGPAMLLRIGAARLRGTQSYFNHRVIDPAYKPLHWHLDAGHPVGSSSEDIERVAELGRRWLEMAGVGRSDTAVSLLASGPDLGFWQFAWGCRRAGVPALHLGPEATGPMVAELTPTVLAGRAADLERLALEVPGALGSVRTALVVGPPMEPRTRDALRSSLGSPDAAVLAAWAPPMARALWAECRGTVDCGGGLHTWPDCEIVDIVDDGGRPTSREGEGDLVWSSLGWRGTVLLRFRTGGRATLDDTRCPACGRSTPRVRPGLPAPKPAKRGRAGRAGAASRVG
ncbi:MAG: phenylacetate--CoA ligase family protein [Acidimicrobiales bacterium]